MLDESKRKRPFRPKSEEHKRRIGEAIYRGIQDFKKCPRCGETKPKEEFGLRSNGKFLKSRCKPCEAICVAEARKRNPWTTRRQNNKLRFRVYGIVEEDYMMMLQEQGGVCAICGSPPGEKSLAIDHSHEDLYVRGLLCSSCNLMLGAARDRPDILTNAILYLEDWKSKTERRYVPTKYLHRLHPSGKTPKGTRK